MICDWLWDVNLLYRFSQNGCSCEVWTSCGNCSLLEHTALDDSHRTLQVFLPRVRAWRCLDADGRNILPDRSLAHAKLWGISVHSAWVYSWEVATGLTEVGTWHSPKFCVFTSRADLRISLLAQVFAQIYTWKLWSVSWNAGQRDQKNVFEVSTFSSVWGCFDS